MNIVFILIFLVVFGYVVYYISNLLLKKRITESFNGNLNPNMTINQLLPVVTQWLSTPVIEEVTMQNSDKEKSRAIKTEAWEQLPFDDLRYINSQHKNPSDMYAELKLKGMLLDLKSVLARAS